MITTESQPKTGNGNNKRRVWMWGLTAVFILAGISYGGYWMWFGRYTVATDNAYVHGNIVQVTPQTSGTVLSIYADNTDFVRAGSPLVRLDEADAKVALDQAEANLAQTIREVRSLFSHDNSLSATVAQRESDLKRQRMDLLRRQALEGTGAVASEEIAHAKEAVMAAESALAAACEQQRSNHALIDRTTVETHPQVLRAAARVREQYLAWQRATIPAPVDGYVAKRQVQLGQKVNPGAPLMAVIPLDQVWVEANFKESQLRDMHIGQAVKLHSDIFGSQVSYDGTIEGFSAGTGSAFSLLPAQNATGNWIKVVQRLPVRIALDPKQLAEHPLSIGLSMVAEVDVRDQGGERLSSGKAKTRVAKTEVFSALPEAAEKRVQQLIAENILPYVANTVGPTDMNEKLTSRTALRPATTTCQAGKHSI